VRAQVSRLARSLVDWVRGQPVIPAGRRTRLGGITLLALLAVGSTTALTLDRIYAVPAGAVFRVGDTLVTEQQLTERITLLGALYGVRQPTDPAGLDRFRRDSAKAVAMSEVLDEAARARGIVIADKTANDQLTNMLEQSFPEGRDAFVAKLRGIGLTEQAVLDEIKRQLANAQLYDQVTQDVPTPTEQEVAATYQQRRAEMAIPEKRHLRNIVVSGPDQAAQIRGHLDGGADFAALARQTSLDDSTKAGGGDLGAVARNQLEKAYGDAAFGTGPNTLFGPVQTQYGWNVGQVLEVSPAVPLSLDQVRGQLQAFLLDQRKLDTWNRWLTEQLRAARIRYADAYRPADPEGAVPDPTAQR
jgi:peptidyl-prolyl cis-trans isomerase C